MIWSVVSKAEMQGYKIPPVFQYYREVIGKENISLAVVEENDPLAFVHDDDVVLLRTASKQLINTIEKKGVFTTAEPYAVYESVRDKAELGRFLSYKGVLVPNQYSVSQVKEVRAYFVKPRYGSESFGITTDCICITKEEVIKQVRRIENELGQPAMIEDFVSGVDCTTACYSVIGKDEVKAHPIKVENDEMGGIQTHVSKFDYNEYCSALTGEAGEKACKISKQVFKLLGIMHHARIDYRMDANGNLYLIDVNLLPGLGPSAHFSKCLLLTENISYRDTIKAILNSATKI